MKYCDIYYYFDGPCPSQNTTTALAAGDGHTHSLSNYCYIYKHFFIFQICISIGKPKIFTRFLAKILFIPKAALTKSAALILSRDSTVSQSSASTEVSKLSKSNCYCYLYIIEIRKSFFGKVSFSRRRKCLPKTKIIF